jgi:hypothetical protein
LYKAAAEEERLALLLAEPLDDPVGGAVVLKILVLDVDRSELDAADAGLAEPFFGKGALKSGPLSYSRCSSYSPGRPGPP